MVTYAQSECPLITNSEHGDAREILASTVGRPCEATEVRIVAPETHRVVGCGEVGEIQVRSPMMMSGYYGAPDQTTEAIGSDGFLRTGDIGSMDEQGYLRILDRVRDVVIRGGENIYPAEVEAALGEHPGVARCAVVGIPDRRWGEQVGACVVARGAPLDGAVLEKFLAGRIAHFKIPRTWLFVDEVPMTASGKIRRNVVRSQMADTVRNVTAED
jgi:acyl-CoA synthetase (AMP-forming)/AMP-acid ligase II